VLVLVAFAALGWRANLLGVRTVPPLGSVAAAFDATPAYPGYTWMRDGGSVSEFELATIAGPGHCGWESAAFLQGPFRVLLERDVKLPSDAKPTGHKLGAIELFLSPSDEDRWIYVAGPSNIERWPRSDPKTLCS